MVDQNILDDCSEELLNMMDECPFLDQYMTSEMGCHRCSNGDKPYCITAIMDDICCNEEIISFLEEKMDEADAGEMEVREVPLLHEDD